MLGVAKLSRELVELTSLSRADCRRHLSRVLETKWKASSGLSKDLSKVMRPAWHYTVGVLSDPSSNI